MLNINYTPPVLKLETDKFKDFILSLKYLYQNQEPEVTTANLLAYLLTDRCEAYPSKRAMNAQMDHLYGLSLDTKTSALGFSHCLEIRIKTLNPRYTQGDIVTESLRFLGSCLRFPMITEDTFNEAKINMTSALKRIEDHPTYLGLIEAAKAVGQDQPLGTFSQGNLVTLSNLTLEEVKAFHQRILATQPVVFFSGEPELMAGVDLSSFIQGRLSPQSSAYAFKTASHHASILEREIEQTNLTQLYTTDVLYNDENYIAMRLMVIMLGQLPNSLLFNEIREKRSLCYSINASSMNFDGIMSIQTGIAFENVEEVRRLIEVQIARLAEGNFPIKLLTIAQKMMRSSMESIADDRSAYLNFLFQRILTGHELDTSDILKRIKQVTKPDIQVAAKKLTKVSEIVLKGTR